MELSLASFMNVCLDEKTKIDLKVIEPSMNYEEK